MISFKNTINRSNKRKAFSREYYEETIANWLLHKWLTTEEAEDVFVVLNEVYPVDETEIEE